MLLHHRRSIRKSVAEIKNTCNLTSESIIWNVIGYNLSPVYKEDYAPSDILMYQKYEDIMELLERISMSPNTHRKWVDGAVNE